MIYKLPSTKPGHVRVMFELPSCLWADRIFVTGDFVQWDREAIPFHQDRDGVWRATVDLPASHRYEFRYLIDGRWQTHYHADGFIDNGYGTDNAVIDLEMAVTMSLPRHRSAMVIDAPVEHRNLPMPAMPAPASPLVEPAERKPYRQRVAA